MPFNQNERKQYPPRNYDRRGNNNFSNNSNIQTTGQDNNDGWGQFSDPTPEASLALSNQSQQNTFDSGWNLGQCDSQNFNSPTTQQDQATIDYGWGSGFVDSSNVNNTNFNISLSSQQNKISNSTKDWTSCDAPNSENKFNISPKQNENFGSNDTRPHRNNYNKPNYTRNNNNSQQNNLSWTPNDSTSPNKPHTNKPYRNQSVQQNKNWVSGNGDIPKVNRSHSNKDYHGHDNRTHQDRSYENFSFKETNFKTNHPFNKGSNSSPPVHDKTPFTGRRFYKEIELKQNCYREVTITNTKDPNHFFVRLVELDDEYNKLLKELSEIKHTPLPTPYHKGSPVCVLFKGNWYRGILHDVNDIRVEIFDIGRTISYRDGAYLKQIDQKYLDKPSYAIKCSLTEDIPITNQSVDNFRKNFADKKFLIKFTLYQRSTHRWLVKLYSLTELVSVEKYILIDKTAKELISNEDFANNTIIKGEILPMNYSSLKCENNQESIFYIKTNSHETEYTNLFKEMFDYYSKLPKRAWRLSQKDVKLNRIIAILDENKWHRAIITSISDVCTVSLNNDETAANSLASGTVICFDFDRARYINISLEIVRNLLDCFARLPPQAVKCVSSDLTEEIINKKNIMENSVNVKCQIINKNETERNFYNVKIIEFPDESDSFKGFDTFETFQQTNLANDTFKFADVNIEKSNEKRDDDYDEWSNHPSIPATIENVDKPNLNDLKSIDSIYDSTVDSSYGVNENQFSSLKSSTLYETESIQTFNDESLKTIEIFNVEKHNENEKHEDELNKNSNNLVQNIIKTENDTIENNEIINESAKSDNLIDFNKSFNDEISQFDDNSNVDNGEKLEEIKKSNDISLDNLDPVSSSFLNESPKIENIKQEITEKEVVDEEMSLSKDILNEIVSTINEKIEIKDEIINNDLIDEKKFGSINMKLIEQFADTLTEKVLNDVYIEATKPY